MPHVQRPRETFPPFACSRIAESGGSIRLVLVGELDLATRARLEEELDDAQSDSHRIVLDLGALRLIDMAGFVTILGAARRARREDAVLILMSPRGQVRRLLDRIGAPRGVVVLEHSDIPHCGARVAA